jgi:hypothetical protein
MLSRTIRTIVKLANNKNFLKLATQRCFATTKGSENLKKCLDKEITYEESNYQPVSTEDSTKFLKENGFSYHEHENTTQLELKRTVDNMEVRVVFTARLVSHIKIDPRLHQKKNHKRNKDNNKKRNNQKMCVISGS